MIEDHARIDRLLTASEKHDGSIDHRSLCVREVSTRSLATHRHGGTGPPAVRAHERGGEALPVAASLRADRGEIAKLLVRSPTSSILAALRELLGWHNALEKGPHGLYSTCDELSGNEPTSVVTRLRPQPNVPLAKYYDDPLTGDR